MEDLFAYTFLHNDLKTWGIAFLFIIGSLVGGKMLTWFIEKIVKKITSKTKTNFDDVIIEACKKPIIFFITVMGFWYAIKTLTIPNEKIALFFFKAHLFLVIINVTWLVSRVVNGLLYAYLFPYAKREDTSFDEQLLPILKTSFSAMIWVVGVVVALDNLQFDIGAMLAGMGIGGLALALAAQDIVKNIFGGIMIFLDKPFTIGERIIINGFDGNVERVGLRSTRVRTLEGRIVTIPNSQFNDNAIVNIVSEPTRRIVIQLNLTYSTSPEKMKLACTVLKGIVASHHKVLTKECVTSFFEFGDFNLGIKFIYYIKSGNDYFAVQNDVNIEILRQFNEHELQFSFPTQTIYNIPSQELS